MYHLEWPQCKIRVFVTDIHEIRYLGLLYSIFAVASLSTANQCIKRKNSMDLHSLYRSKLQRYRAVFLR